MRQLALLPTLAALTAALCLTSCGGEKFPIRTYRLGDRVSLGRLTYTVFETQWASRFGADPTPRLPEHRFFLLRMSINNAGGADLLSPNLTLEDSKGNSYSEVSNGEGVPQWIGYLRRVKTAEAIQGNMLFDVPPGAYNLRVLDETGEKAALIEIPLSFNSETPEIPAVPQDLKKE